MIELTDKQKEYTYKATARWSIKSGAVRSGKSFVDTAYVIPSRILERKGKPGLAVILGVSKSTIERNVLQPMREIYGYKRVGNINSENVATLFGEKVYCLGAEKVSQVAKVLGASFKYCYGDEVAKWNEEVFNIVKSRLDKEYSCFDGSLNPESPTHWLKRFLDSDADIYLQEYTLFDNPHLPQDFVENLCNEYKGTVYYDRLVLGKWMRAEGLIFPTFTEENIYNDQTRPVALYNTSVRMISVDYGTTNPCVFLDTYDDGNIIWVDDEYRWDSRSNEAKRTGNPQKTDSQYADDMIAFMGTEPERICNIIVDPSAASFIAELRGRGLVVTGADNNVLDGIRIMNTMFASKKIMIHERCKGLIDELHSYVWDDKATAYGEDKPVKEADHGCDNLRYRILQLPQWRKSWNL
jgi:PBSX family phage terminase large subunit